MTRPLRSEAIGGLFWSALEQGGRQGIQVVITVILARLLVPAQFGLIGMLVVFMGIAEAFIDSGFASALIQKKNADHVDECSIFYFNILVGIVAAGLLCAVAPWIAAFYKQPLLAPLTRVLSLKLIIGAFGIVQISLLTKHLDFKTQVKVSVIATVLSGTVGVAMAAHGFGVWSLVAQSLMLSLTQTVCLWFFNTWRPRLIFSFKSLRDMFGFGSRLLASGLLNRIFEDIHLVVIGRLFSVGDVGLYAQAKRLPQVVTENVSTPVARVAFPALATIQHDAARLKHCMRKAVAVLGFVNFPLMIGLATVARSFVLVLLTDKWVAAVPYIQLICVSGLLYPLHAINLNLLKAQGRSDLFLRLEVLKRLLVVVSIVVCYRWGITGLIAGQIVVSLLGYYLNTYYTGKLIDYPLTEQVADLLPYLAISLAMGCGVYLVRYLPLSSRVAVLAIQVFAGAWLYAGLSYVLRVPAYLEVVDTMKHAIKPYLLAGAGN